MLSEPQHSQAKRTRYFIDDRDGNEYSYVIFNDLKWFAENLKFKTDSSLSINPVEQGNTSLECGEFYFVSEAFKVCPSGWRLPTEKEVKKLISQNKKGQIMALEELRIGLCGRIDNGAYSKKGLQNTFWIDAKLKQGDITHWHIYSQEMKLHSHNVNNAHRQFPVRCVCEAEQNNQ